MKTAFFYSNKVTFSSQWHCSYQGSGCYTCTWSGFYIHKGACLGQYSDTVPVSGGVGCCKWSHEDHSYPGGTSIPMTAATQGGQWCTNLQSVTTYHSSLKRPYLNVKETIQICKISNISMAVCYRIVTIFVCVKVYHSFKQRKDSDMCYKYCSCDNVAVSDF